MTKRLFRRVLQGIAAVVGLAVAGVVAIIVFAWVERRASVELPAPTGPFAVGRVIAAWSDQAPDTLAPVPGARRELLVWIWYPAADMPQAVEREEYVPAAMREGDGPPRGLFSLLTTPAENVRPHAVRGAALATRQPACPILIIRGGASASVVNYTALAEDLASHGYVVVGFDAPYRTNVVVFPDGRVLRRTDENNPERCIGADAPCIEKLLAAWTRDVAFVLDRLERLNASDPAGRFTGRLDIARVGVFGHSLGGVTAAQFCHDDSRCRAAADVDGAPVGRVVQTGVGKPFMFLLSDHGDLTADAESRRIDADIRSIYDRLPPAARVRAMIRGANHFTFSDDGAVLKSRVVRAVLRVSGGLAIEGRRQIAVTAYCLRTFFDAHLKGPVPSRVELTSPQFPEIEVYR